MEELNNQIKIIKKTLEDNFKNQSITELTVKNQLVIMEVLKKILKKLKIIPKF